MTVKSQEFSGSRKNADTAEGADEIIKKLLSDDPKIFLLELTTTNDPQKDIFIDAIRDVMKEHGEPEYMFPYFLTASIPEIAFSDRARLAEYINAWFLCQKEVNENVYQAALGMNCFWSRFNNRLFNPVNQEEIHKASKHLADKRKMRIFDALTPSNADWVLAYCEDIIEIFIFIEKSPSTLLLLMSVELGMEAFLYQHKFRQALLEWIIEKKKKDMNFFHDLDFSSSIISSVCDDANFSKQKLIEYGLFHYKCNTEED